MRKDLVCAVLECGFDELGVLDRSRADLREVVEDMKMEGARLTLAEIVRSMFLEAAKGFSIIVIGDLMSLGMQERDGRISGDDASRLAALRESRVNPLMDFWLDGELANRRIFCDSEKREAYESLYPKTVSLMEEYLGFEVEYAEKGGERENAQQCEKLCQDGGDQ